MNEDLKEYIDLDYKKFQEKLIPNTNILGVRGDILKKIAKEYARNNLAYFNYDLVYHEDKMIYMYMLSYIKDINLIYDKLDIFVPKIENWAQCDSLMNIKIIRKNRDYFKPLIEKYRYSLNEFESRFSIIMLMHYMDYDYLDYIFDCINNVKNNKYYLEMACAWILCECFIKFREYTLNRINDLNVSDFIFNKAISKICDSYRVSLEDKLYLKSLKRNNI